MEELVCNICHEEFLIQGEINSCNHVFCHDCIAKWATIENSCPCCKVRFDVIRRKKISCTPGRLSNLPPYAPIPGKVIGEERCEEVNQRPIFEDPSFEQWIQNVVCLVCGNADNEDQLLLCDECDGACHTYCAHLDSIPEGEWFCSSCTAHRSRATQRQQRRALQQQQAEERSRRRQRRNVIASEDDEDDEVQIAGDRSARDININRTTRNGNRGGGGGAARTAGGNGDLEGFIVSDSEGQSNSQEEEDEEVPLEVRLRRRRGGGGGGGGGGGLRRGRGGGGGGGNATRQQRQRHERAVRDALDSDFEEEEDLDVDSPAVVAGALERERARRRIRGNNNNTIGTASTRSNRIRFHSETFGNIAMRQPVQQQRQQQQQSIQADDVTPATTARHAVELLTNNWDSVRRGTTSFSQLLAHGGGNNNYNRNDNRRSRQGREAARARVAAEKESEDVIDLCEESSPAAVAAPTTTRPGGLSPPLGITSLSSKLRAELNACREKGAKLPSRKHSTAGGGGGPADDANKNNNNRKANFNTSDDAYFAAAAVAATLDNANTNNNRNYSSSRAQAMRNHSATPRSPGSASWRRTNNLGSPGSGGPHRMRTVRDVNRSAEVARRTPVPIGGDGRMFPPSQVGATRVFDRLDTRQYSSPAPLQQRLAARAAAEWGNTPHDAVGIGSLNRNTREQASALPGWHRVKRLAPSVKPPSYYPHQQEQEQATTQRQFKPRVAIEFNLYPHLSTSPGKQRQQQQQQPEVVEPERRDIPMFLRNKKETTSTATNPQEQQQQQQLQSPSYSPPTAQRRNSAAIHNNITTSPTTAVKNAKQQAYDAVRSHIRIYLSEEVITREQYKKIARAATRRLYERHGGAPPDDAPNSQEVALVVDEAMISVIKGEI
ncbi:hypothetical protein Ndes2526B_g00854 [Nannochloris sp. 'desiccata']